MQIINGINHTNEIKALIIKYTNALGRDLSFQELDKELENINLKYTPPFGRMLGAKLHNEIIGCVMFHKLEEKICEMKRLYVKPEYRKTGAGSALVQEIINLAKEDKFDKMVLDTIAPLKSALSLYKKFGFTECTPYYNNPMEDVIYMELKLNDSCK